MPVTARLSRKFYEKLGEDIAQELVDWFNMVDATYRQDLREMNELNFARFDAKLEQRVTELEAKIDTGFAKVFEGMERRVATVRTDIIKWMFVFWATNALIVFGLVSRFMPG